jgi:hypothetical protein
MTAAKKTAAKKVVTFVVVRCGNILCVCGCLPPTLPEFLTKTLLGVEELLQLRGGNRAIVLSLSVGHLRPVH